MTAPDPATTAYFAATADGPFDHQRDAYEQGFEDGADAERQRIRNMVAGEIVLRGGFSEAGAVLKYLADLLDGDGDG